jgi:hypothetical protein
MVCFGYVSVNTLHKGDNVIIIIIIIIIITATEVTAVGYGLLKGFRLLCGLQYKSVCCGLPTY